MEQWKMATDEQYKKNLCEVVKFITEELFSQASAGHPYPPEKHIHVHSISEGRHNAVGLEVLSDKYKFYRVVFWHDFVTAMESLCYKITKDSAFNYIITPNPSC